MYSENKPTPEFAKILLSYLPKRLNYLAWIRIISALGNTFDEARSLDILLSHFQDESKDEHLLKLRQKLQNMTFGTLVYMAKEYGYNSENQTYSNKHMFIHTIKKKNLPKKETVSISGNPQILFRAKKSNPNEKERVYQLSVNEKVLNKNLNPKTLKKYQNYSVLTNEFENRFLILDELINSIGQGFAFCCSQLNENESGKRTRKNANFLCCDFFALDIDEGLTIEECLAMEQTKGALFIYTTPSHTEQNNRFRIVFPFPRMITDPRIYRGVAEHYINIYKADKQCSDPSRAFYGNINATIYNIQSGEILEFKEGVLYEEFPN